MVQWGSSERIDITPSQRELLGIVASTSRRLSMECFVVGGVVRDLLREARILDRDLDFIVVGDARVCAEHCARSLSGELKIFNSFLTAKVISPQQLRDIAEIDFATARSEVYERPGALPRVTPATLEHDLARRDFTVNALALSVTMFLELLVSSSPTVDRLAAAVIDHCGGLADLSKRCIRILHAKSFLDDPTRIFRALRYVSRLQGSLEAGTEAALSDAIGSGALRTVSVARALTELRKMCAEHDWANLLIEIERRGIWKEALRCNDRVAARIARRVPHLAQVPGKLIATSRESLWSVVLAIMFMDESGRFEEQEMRALRLPNASVRCVAKFIADRLTCSAECNAGLVLSLAVIDELSAGERAQVNQEIEKRVGGGSTA